MPDHELTATQKGEVALTLRSTGLRIRDFDWVEQYTEATRVGGGQNVPTIQAVVHTPTGYAFAFDLDMNNRNSLWVIFRPGLQGPSQREHAGTWQSVMSYFRQWADLVKREQDTPDLWSEMLDAEVGLATSDPRESIDNTPFTADERQEISHQLQEMRQLIVQSFDIHAEQTAVLNGRVEYVIEATARMGKFDWRSLLAGQLLSLVVTAVIPQHALAVIGPFLTRTIGHLFGGSHPALPGGTDLLT